MLKDHQDRGRKAENKRMRKGSIMKNRGIFGLSVLFILLLLNFMACRESEVSFPVEKDYYDRINRNFERLWKTNDPVVFAEISQSLISDLDNWSEASALRQNKILLSADENVMRNWKRLMNQSYQLVVANHVQAYILKSRIVKPQYFETREKILQSLDPLILALNRYIIKNYPMKTLDLAYYKNLPDITSRTSDAAGNIYFIIKVDIGYLREEKQTQTAVNNSKVAMVDLVRSYCSQLTENELLGWNELNVKAGLMKEINDYLVQFYDFKQGKMEGVKMIAISKIQTFPFN